MASAFGCGKVVCILAIGLRQDWIIIASNWKTGKLWEQT
jgi:hypothetical protein